MNPIEEYLKALEKIIITIDEQIVDLANVAHDLKKANEVRWRSFKLMAFTLGIFTGWLLGEWLNK